MKAPILLRSLPMALRLGLSGVVLALGLGLLTSLEHLVAHHEKRDEVPGMSLEDVQAAYHGIRSPARLRTALEAGHPETLAASDRQALLEWLRGTRIAESYDDPDLGERAPAELIAARCVQCHNKKAEGPAAQLPLEYWEEIKKHAFERSLDATPKAIVAASAHAHAPALALWSLAVMLLLWCTRWPAWLRQLLCASLGLALALDLASWFLARDTLAFVYGIVLGGGVWALAMSCALLLILAELWLPQRRTP